MKIPELELNIAFHQSRPRRAEPSQADEHERDNCAANEGGDDVLHRPLLAMAVAIDRGDHRIGDRRRNLDAARRNGLLHSPPAGKNAPEGGQSARGSEAAGDSAGHARPGPVTVPRQWTLTPLTRDRLGEIEHKLLRSKRHECIYYIEK